VPFPSKEAEPEEKQEKGKDIAETEGKKEEEKKEETPLEPSSLQCFTNQKGHNGRDVFCLLHNVVLRPSGQIQAFCSLSVEAKKKIASFPTFMYSTGLGASMQNFEGLEKPPTCLHGFSSPIAALVKRDGDANLFHMYAEFFSFFLTFEVLGLNMSESQVVLLDNRGDGYEFEVWEALTGKPAKRPGSFPEGTCSEMAIYTIPAGSSPLWRGSWEVGFPFFMNRFLTKNLPPPPLSPGLSLFRFSPIPKVHGHHLFLLPPSPNPGSQSHPDPDHPAC